MMVEVINPWFLLIIILKIVVCSGQFPIVITTWKFESAAAEAWKTIQQKSAIDAIEAGCSTCEVNQCDGTVGYGGSPDENGETTLEAMIMDGNTMNVGAVAAMRRVKKAVSVARSVLEHTAHSILAGDLATKFAVNMGFKEESLSTDRSLDMWKNWKDKSCQPNFWKNVSPDPKKSCGPYKMQNSDNAKHTTRDAFRINSKNHDTIGMIAIDKSGSIAAGTSTNGATHKIPGRVGDSPIPGAGAYADSSVGASAATGDGDIMLRFLPSFLAVEEMRRGTNPTLAAAIAIKRIADHYPSFVGGLIALDKEGNYGAACHGMESFPFSVASLKTNNVQVENVSCLPPSKRDQISVKLI